MEADPLETNDEYRAIEGERSLSNFKYSLNSKLENDNAILVNENRLKKLIENYSTCWPSLPFSVNNPK